MHQSWIAIVGIVFGGAAGLIYAIRVAMAVNKDPKLQDDDTSIPGQDKGSPGKGGRRSGFMTDEAARLVALTDAGLQALLKRAIRITLMVGRAGRAGAVESLRLAQCRHDGHGRCHFRRKHLRVAPADPLDQCQNGPTTGPARRSGLGRPFCAPAGHLCRGHLW